MQYSKQSDSAANLVRAFEGEATGHVRYMILADEAESEESYDLARLYRSLAAEELAHAKIWYKEINGDTEQNSLQNSIDRENTEHNYTYPRYAVRAELEGYEALADMFNATARVEGEHSEMLGAFLPQNEKERFSSPEEAVWRCSVCGNTHIGTAPPEQCPLCGYNKTVYRR